MNKFKDVSKVVALSFLSKEQVERLKGLMPESSCFDVDDDESYIGFHVGTAGTWMWESDLEIISYEEMLSFLGELTPHMHQKEIIAWANGATIQSSFQSAAWLDIRLNKPAWSSVCRYRIKPELTHTQQAIEQKEQELVALKQQDLVERGIEVVLNES